MLAVSQYNKRRHNNRKHIKQISVSGMYGRPESAASMWVYVYNREHDGFSVRTSECWILTCLSARAFVGGGGWALVCGDDNDDDKYNQHNKNTLYHAPANRKQIADSSRLLAENVFDYNNSAGAWIIRKQALIENLFLRHREPSLSLSSSSSASSPLFPSSSPPALSAVDCGIVNVYNDYTWPYRDVTVCRFLGRILHAKLSLYIAAFVKNCGSMMFRTWTLSGRYWCRYAIFLWYVGCIQPRGVITMAKF